MKVRINQLKPGECFVSLASNTPIYQLVAVDPGLGLALAHAGKSPSLELVINTTNKVGMLMDGYAEVRKITRSE